MRRRKRSLEKLFFPISKSDDWVFCEEEPHTSYFEDLRAFGFIPGKYCNFIPDFERLVTWGDLETPIEGSFQIDPSLKERSSRWNSKLNQAEWKMELGELPFFPSVIRSLEALEDSFEELKFPFVLKANYGFAGRNQIIVQSQKEAWKLQDISRKLGGFPLLLESWKSKRKMDFSTLWEGEKYLTTSRMFLDEKGIFKCIQIGPEEGNKPWTMMSKRVMSQLRSKYEFLGDGPIAIDGFMYEEEDEVLVQPFSEMNFRWSIGRLLWEIRQSRGAQFAFIAFVNNPSYLLEEKEQIAKDWKINLCPITPICDSKGKLYDSVAMYGESNSNTLYFIHGIGLR